MAKSAKIHLIPVSTVHNVTWMMNHSPQYFAKMMKEYGVMIHQVNFFENKFNTVATSFEFVGKCQHRYTPFSVSTATFWMVWV